MTVTGHEMDQLLALAAREQRPKPRPDAVELVEKLASVRHDPKTDNPGGKP